MDWKGVISRNCETLSRIVATLFALAGDGAAKVERRAYFAALRILRPAESALRRLIIIAALGLALKPRSGAAFPERLMAGEGSSSRAPAFALLDPLKSFACRAPQTVPGHMPRISVPGLFDPVFPPVRRIAAPEDLVNAENLCRRIEALRLALANVPKQAKRLARWRAKRDLALAGNMPRRVKRLSPFRPGHPPGHRKRHAHEVDYLLKECHALALDAMDGL